MTKCTDNLTLGEIKELMSLFGNSKVVTTNNKNPMIGKHCIVRSYSAGVHFGIIEDVDNTAAGQGCEVLISNARRIWKWEGAFTLSEVAQNGVAKTSRIAMEVPEIYISGVIEIIPTTNKAQKCFEVCNEK